MTREDDFIGQLEGYLEQYEGMTPLPDPVRHALRAQLPITKQLGRSNRPMRRFPVMNNNIARFGLAAAVIVLAILVGIQFLPGPNVGSDSSATPTATPMALHGGQLEAGTYVVSSADAPIRTPVSFTFTVPPGWIERTEKLYIYKRADTAQVGFVPWVVTHVYSDACHSEGALKEVGPTVDDLVAALMDQAHSDATTPVEVEVGGYPAKYISMSVPADVHTSMCRYPGTVLQIWANPEETDFFAIPVNPVHPHAYPVSGVYIVDVNGQRVVLLAGHDPESTAADIAELEAIIASIHFEP